MRIISSFMVIYPGYSEKTSWYFASDVWYNRLNVPALQNLLLSLHFSSELSLPSGLLLYVPSLLCISWLPQCADMICQINFSQRGKLEKTNTECKGNFPTRWQDEKRPGSRRASPNCYSEEKMPSQSKFRQPLNPMKHIFLQSHHTPNATSKQLWQSWRFTPQTWN